MFIPLFSSILSTHTYAFRFHSMNLSEEFMKWKQQCLNKVDFSKKGSVDTDIAHIVQRLNAEDHFFTTSSCSGRIILVDTPSSNSFEVQKQNCSWLFVTHQKCKKDDVIAALQKANGDAVFKFEAFVLHVQCQLLEDAQLLHSVAINSGFRNSGITVGKKGKIVMAVRSTHCLEVPLCRKGTLLVNEDYIDYLVQAANLKMEENKHRIDRFYSCLQSALSTEDCVTNPTVEFEKNGTVYTRRRKKNKEAKDITPLSAEDSDSDVDLQTGLILFNEPH
ncbi:tRNA wybutosine-synthesizing protein 3 homolog isoform X1 [Ambystoma mexicanum]|uniref:tRNA wybutosine-synthesizing protein 3 homolog isoform X1 n=1 Tax=Ambystoma mexicanum TaxID=8296 RepID=UPI0037E793A9